MQIGGKNKLVSSFKFKKEFLPFWHGTLGKRLIASFVVKAPRSKTNDNFTNFIFKNFSGFKLDKIR